MRPVGQPRLRVTAEGEPRTRRHSHRPPRPRSHRVQRQARSLEPGLHRGIVRKVVDGGAGARESALVCGSAHVDARPRGPRFGDGAGGGGAAAAAAAPPPPAAPRAARGADAGAEAGDAAAAPAAAEASAPSALATLIHWRRRTVPLARGPRSSPSASSPGSAHARAALTAAGWAHPERADVHRAAHRSVAAPLAARRRRLPGWDCSRAPPLVRPLQRSAARGRRCRRPPARRPTRFSAVSRLANQVQLKGVQPAARHRAAQPAVVAHPLVLLEVTACSPSTCSRSRPPPPPRALRPRGARARLRRLNGDYSIRIITVLTRS